MICVGRRRRMELSKLLRVFVSFGCCGRGGVGAGLQPINSADVHEKTHVSQKHQDLHTVAVPRKTC